MVIQSVISSEAEEKLKCSLCNNYLSHFPIFLSSKNESFCGRCTIPEGTTCFQNEPFEVACQSFKFPCRYQSAGCDEELVPKEVPLHEIKCPFRMVPCLINKPIACQWKGNLPRLAQHCQTDHADIILKDGEFQMDLTISEETDSLIEQGADFYVFSKELDSDTQMLRCALFNFANQTESSQLCAVLSIKNENRRFLLDLNVSEIEEKDSFIEIHLGCLRNGKKDPKLVSGKIELINENDKKLDNVEDSSNFLSLFKCSKCQKVALPPIYRADDKVLCLDCQVYSYCEECERDYTMIDNVLTKIAQTVNYTCKNQEQGCTYTAKPSQMTSHQIICDFSTVTCVFDKSCSWKCLRKDLSDHVSQNHQNLIHDPSEILELPINDKSRKYKVVQCSGRLFRVAYVCNSDSRCMWSVHLIGHCEEGFKYQIDLLGSTGKELLLSLKMICSKGTNEDAIFTNSERYCYLDWKQYKYLEQPKKEQDNKIRFRVKIKK